MKKFGYHRLVLKDLQVVDGPLVVILGENKSLISWHLLNGEEPMVEWIGGTFTEE